MATKTRKSNAAAPAPAPARKKAAAAPAVAEKAPARKRASEPKVATKTAAKKVAAKDSAPKKPAAKGTVPRSSRKVAMAQVSRGMLDELSGAEAAPAGLPADFFSAYTGAALTDAEYAQAAQALGCEVAAIKAVADVETRGAAFDSNSRPTILYERHIFARNTVPKGKFNASNPELSANVGYGPGGYGSKDQQYTKLDRAYGLDPEAALKAPSWGKFQILGENHKACGFATVFDFVKAMTTSEQEHLRAFCHFVAASPAMLQALRKKDWAGFAQRYNGADYLKFKYDQKMAAAYAKFAG